MSRDNPRAVKITDALAEYTSLDDQPLSVVKNLGLRHLLCILELRYEIPSHTHITDTVLPKLHDFVKKHIHNLLHDVKTLSFTTDIWSSSVSSVSLISLTAQSIDDYFKLQKAILHAKQFRGSHTGQAIADEFDVMLQTWAINKSAVHVVLRDNAKNMVKAMRDVELLILPCVAHTLQLAVKEGLLAQRNVADAVAVGRKIVGHFKHSALAYSQLEDIQVQLNQPVKRLQQDVPTRWNSTYYMFQSLIGNDNFIVTAPQWSLFEKILSVLAPFEELTQKMSSRDALASDVIPAVIVLMRLLTNETDEDHGIKTMKETLAAAVKRHLGDRETNPMYCIGTLLNLRYKDRFFSNTDTATEAKEMLMLWRMSTGEADKQEDLGDPPVRKLRKVQASSSLDSLMR
ncbi:zinc finger BED domain-containing protein 4-like [Acanthochromis polyacanthus]|uniref:zinc finger BED domain-containing protein 4-like n=1 Tax=Acanthochromis polyacanthus TaxID=80966 RepID=UPI002234E2B8|nr:zinc finger BED domain-containing protein 4-like [Acanthochromis polyacanthus]XP_051809822.1 zinc finger BED domain-containing protein 4-like [Acanthochromis polyacanthus]